LSSGAYKVTASKDKVGTQTLNANVRQGPNNPMAFTLSATSGVSAGDKEAAAAIQASAGAAVEAMKAGRHDEAIAKFQEVIAKVPTCSDCYYNIGVSQMAKHTWCRLTTSLTDKIYTFTPFLGRRLTRCAPTAGLVCKSMKSRILLSGEV